MKLEISDTVVQVIALAYMVKSVMEAFVQHMGKSDEKKTSPKI